MSLEIAKLIDLAATAAQAGEHIKSAEHRAKAAALAAKDNLHADAVIHWLGVCDSCCRAEEPDKATSALGEADSLLVKHANAMPDYLRDIASTRRDQIAQVLAAIAAKTAAESAAQAEKEAVELAELEAQIAAEAAAKAAEAGSQT
jgi:hypothetical protein